MSETKIQMSVLPFLTPFEPAEPGALPLFRDWACGADGLLLVDSGHMTLLSGQEALRIWASKALRTAVARFAAYTADYGSELEELIGQPYTEAYIRAESQRMITEALLASPYIVEVGGASASMTGDGRLSVTANYRSVYGTADLEVFV